MSIRTFFTRSSAGHESGAAPVWALDLNGAMSGLPAAKTAGQLGEKPNGYLGVVNNREMRPTLPD